MTTKPKEKSTLQPKPPVVVVLGHVDHGKTKLLDYIRKTNVVDKEAGGITQRIGAYEIAHNGKKITFLDTPGHESFSHIRSRGAKAADIAVLVVATEEGVKPQTKEAITHAKEAGIPIIVALNKVDKPEANPEKVKRELAELDVAVESLGGEVPSVPISAKEGQGIEELLELITLVAELHDFRVDPSGPASGVVLESHLDPKRGQTISLLIDKGTLKKSDWFWVGGTYGRVKTLENFLGAPIEEAIPSQPVTVTGVLGVTQAGERFGVTESEEEAKRRAEEERTIVLQKSAAVLKEETLGEGRKVFRIVMKADVASSLEAIYKELEKITHAGIAITVLRSEIGDIGEDDVKLAGSSNAVIFGFHVRRALDIEEIVKRFRVKIITSDIIYELMAKIKEEASKLLAPTISRKKVGRVKILAIFRRESPSRIIVGGKVSSGEVRRGTPFAILREKKEEGLGRVVQLQRQKKDTDKVGEGEECGLMAETQDEIREGDILECFEEVKEAQSL